jgi:hypothetical protein
VPTLSLEQRSLNASIAANVRWSRESGVAGTARARKLGPGQMCYWENFVDPDRLLPTTERQRRAECARRAYYQKLGKKSGEVRRARSNTAP